jgi:uncharacterized protein YndB with AHSA1/START domain
MHVTRDIVLDVDIAEAWELLTDPDELATWLGTPTGSDLVEPDGTVRHTSVADVVEGTRIGFFWWSDEEPVSRVEFELFEEDGATRLTVTETVKASVARWDGRLLDLELRCLTRHAVRV